MRSLSLANVRSMSFSSSEPSTPSSDGTDSRNTLYADNGSLSIGQVNRLLITVNRQELDSNLLQRDELGEFLWLRAKNVELNLFRPIYLTGPFCFYVDVTPCNYSKSKKFDEPIQYNLDIKPGQSFKAKLHLTKGSLKNGSDHVHCWTVDLVSQLALATHFVINYRISIGYDKKLLKRNNSTTQSLSTSQMEVKKIETQELWSKPPKFRDRPVHLVVLTHGIFSNVGADLLYIKDQIEEMVADNDDANVIVRGYEGNVGKSEKGIRYIGKRVAHYILDLYDKSEYEIDRISFIGHSLGGPVQSYAISHITKLRPQFFTHEVIPINLIAMASPFLGVLTELPKAVSLALDVGVLGSTGRDLTLSHKFPSMMKKADRIDEEEWTKDHKSITSKPILEQIIASSTHRTFENFMNRTLYANAVHDGIVPLRTSALLYLDWRGLGDLKYVKKDEESKPDVVSPADKDMVEEVPSDEAIESESDDTEEEEHNMVSTEATDIETETSSPSSPKIPLRPRTSSFFVQAKNRGKRHRIKKYLKTQTVSSSSNGTSTGESIFQDSDFSDINIPPTASTVLSAANVMLSALPKPEYLINPEIREPTIFHDKIYSFNDLPPPHYSKDDNPFKEVSRLKHFVTGNKKAIEERIARQWHWKMSWRKVLVTLKPDSHNNIIVRRKYGSAWGWGVIAHLADNHFSKEAIEAQNDFVLQRKKDIEEQARQRLALLAA